MADTRIRRCFELCSRLRAGLGDGFHSRLDELERELQSLQDECLIAPLNRKRSLLTGVAAQEPVVVMDMAGYLTDWNRGAELLFGYSAEEAIGQHILFLYADNDAAHGAEIHELFLDHGSSTIEVRRRKKSGETFRANLSLRHIVDDCNDTVGMALHFSEVEDRLSAEDKLRLHSRIIEDSEEGILITDADERIVSVNSAFSRITGYSAKEVIGERPDFLSSGTNEADLQSKIRAAIQGEGAWHGEIVSRRKNGELFPHSVTVGAVRNEDGLISHAFSIFTDVSLLRAAEKRMQQLVNYDSLTGLPNRTLFHQLVDEALFSPRHGNQPGALLVIDLNRFASFNDMLGHDVGDELLRQVGQRFRHALRPEDILARFGGDEFVVALVNTHQKQHVALVAEKLLATLAQPFSIQAHALYVQASIGIAVFPEDGQSTPVLLRFADVAMKRLNKNTESGYLFYSPEMNVHAKEQWQLESELRRALRGNELFLHYQPKVSLRSGRIVGAEALVRWEHPEYGLISPGKFVPLAEEIGLMSELGGWIFDETCRQIRHWLDVGFEFIPIAVNVSARQFDDQLPDHLQASIDRYGIPSELIKLEITESLLLRAPEKIIPIMNRLVALGFSLSLDDFGTGYSSLAYLKRFPITTLKIDRSFVVGVPGDANDCAIAQAIVTMGKQLRQEIVAEGVETRQQMNFLRDLGCDQLQGYLFSPPVSAEAFAEMVREGVRLPL
ncbi:putative bifunctional diguanylate cyclase/phosphodiesterase [Propionivibrio limicola]|uniref:putative bifunctional diguanylate cyclase/phosphodiesterase n=1 Tax=Propionivibrio limicola TaxID=167645 RepID=UPI001291F9F9|nr:EAL domain-containing protein [Propionivibrio limicola]